LVPACRFVSLLPLLLAALAWSSCRDSSASGTESTPHPAAAATSEKLVTLPGVDISAMTARERSEWSALVTDLSSPCSNVPVSLATCIEEKRPCGSCAKAAKWIAHAVREGASDDQVRRAYKDRFDPSSAKTLPLEGSPSKGPSDAAVTIVEFADFECPHCRMAVPVIDSVLATHPDKIRLAFKFVSLPMHVHAESAARAAYSAGRQGEFWEMERLLFERQEHLEDADLERYAQILRLDIAKWKVDMTSASTSARLAQDHELEQGLKLRGTPTIYVNGRELDIESDESLEERVAAELGVPPSAGAGVAPPPSAAARQP
jgi:protein-disulfide isomerase